MDFKSTHTAGHRTLVTSKYPSSNSIEASAIMVLRPHHNYLRKCCEKAHLAATQPYPPVMLLVVENDHNDCEKPQNECDEVEEERRTETTPTDGQEAPEQGPEDQPKDTIPTIPEPAIVNSKMIWPLPPSEIHDGRLFRKVG